MHLPHRKTYKDDKENQQKNDYICGNCLSYFHSLFRRVKKLYLYVHKAKARKIEKENRDYINDFHEWLTVQHKIYFLWQIFTLRMNFLSFERRKMFTVNITV